MEHSKPSRREIRKVFKQHRGAQAVIARELGVRSSAITNWIKGQSVSKRLDIAIPAFAAKVASGEIKITVGSTSGRK